MDFQKIRADFPILSREVYGKPLVYFDNGATTQKPRQVVDAITDEYYSVNANVHRGVHFLCVVVFLRVERKTTAVVAVGALR